MVLAATTADGIVIALIGIAVVLLVSAAFYFVGRAEDRQRERDRIEREALAGDELPAAAAAAGYPAECRSPAGARPRPRRRR